MNRIANNDISFIFCEIKSRLMYKKVLNYLSSIPDYDDIVKRIKEKKKLELFPYSFVDNYSLNNYTINKEGNFLYTVHNNKNLYFSQKYKSKFRAKRYYNNILIEQDELSPHKYLSSNENISSDTIVLDIGGAEGIFSLNIIDKVKKIYIFECDLKWVEALNKTFKNYKNKVEIINKYVSNNDDDNNITIDTFIKRYSLENEKLLIKMDIEGYEEKALDGAKNTIDKNSVKWLICTYHKEKAEKVILEKLTDYKIEFSKGYMLYYYDYDFKEPYLRHGVLRAQKV